MSPSPWSIYQPVPTTTQAPGYLVSHDDGHVALVFTLEDARAVAALPEVVEAAREAKGGLLAIARLLRRQGLSNTAGAALDLITTIEAALSKLEGKS